MTAEIIFAEGDVTKISTEALIVPVVEGDDCLECLPGIDQTTEAQIRRVFARGEFSGKPSQLCLIHTHESRAERILLTGLGGGDQMSPEVLRRSGAKALGRLKEAGLSECSLSVHAFERLPDRIRGDHPPLFYFLEGGLLNLYDFSELKSDTTDRRWPRITVCGGAGNFPLSWLNASVRAVFVARNLVNLPSNLKTPPLFCNRVMGMIGGGLRAKVLDLPDIEKEGMGAYLAVGRGSANDPKFVIIEHEGDGGAPIVLIGKSVTFDSGGISLKPADGMERMKYDMAGGAVVLAVLIAAHELGIPHRIVGILPMTENLPGGNATRPGDVVTAFNGRTIEVVSTDAEGRLALADAIGYAINYFRPRLVIDIATLTGACAIALGREAIAMMGNDQDMMDVMKRASEEVYERVWQMPLYEEYAEVIKSDVADVKNSGGKKGSLVTAGYFLKDFAGATPWVHLDIAGTAWLDNEKPYSPKGGTGIGVRLLLQFFKEMGKEC